ncbi:cache domain-containing protein [Desulfobacterales bacterium HSG16]|nr:cache domain-containing protein [Desulfobacterales bacterium HSG16]
MALINRGICTRLLACFLLLALIPLSVVGFMSYQSGRQRIIFDVESHLESIAILKEQEIDNWIDHLSHTLKWLSENPAVRINTQTMTLRDVSDPEYRKSHEFLMSEFRRTANQEHFSRMFLLDRSDGRIVAASDAEWEGKFRNNEEYFVHGKKNLYISDIFLSLPLGQPIMAVAAPIKDSSGHLAGVLVAHADLQYLDDIMLAHNGLGRTAETFLVNKSNLLITNTVFKPESAFQKWIFGQGAKWALEGKSGIGQFIDYRGVAVIGAYRWLEHRKLALISKQDESEAFASVIGLRDAILGVAVFAALIAIILALFLSRAITIPIHRMVEGAGEIGNGNLDHRINIKSGDEIGVLSRAFDLMAENLRAITVSRNELAKEIFDRKKVEDALRKNERQLQTILDHSPVLISIKSTDGTVILANKKFEMLDMPPIDEIIGKNVFDLFPEDIADALWKNDLAALKADKPVESEEIVLHKDGSSHTYLTVKFPVYGDTERPFGICAISSDITERKRMEKERMDTKAKLQQQQKLESIGILAGGVAHEINNPINGIMNYAQLIKDRLNPENALIEFADEIIIETNRVATIVHNLLAFARYEKEFHSPARISDIVESALSLIRTVIRHDQVTLKTDVPDDLPEIRCRSQQIQQVLMNLMTNARDALNEKYPGYDENKKIILSAHLLEKEGKKWIRTSVVDQGPGIAPEIRERMFDPFFTTKPRDRGTGLGLSISYGIVQEHNGILHMESVQGKYTQFNLDLPVGGGSNPGET